MHYLFGKYTFSHTDTSLFCYQVFIFQLQQLDLLQNFRQRPTGVHLVSYGGVQFSTTEVTRTTGQSSRVQGLGSIFSTCRCCRVLSMVAFGSSRIHNNLLLLTLVVIPKRTVPLCLLPCG